MFLNTESNSMKNTIIKLISDRVVKLDKLISEHKGTKHEYPLVAGKFELLQLGLQIEKIMEKEVA